MSEYRYKVLAVDDEEGMREGIRRVLEKNNFDVDTAADGETALRLLGQSAYDLALLDLKMPGIDGFKITEYINERLLSRTVVVIVSALATVDAAVEVTRHGAFDFLVKPFTPEDLMAVVRRASGQRDLLVEREKYLSQINREKNLSRQMINSMHEGVILLNIKGRPVLMNPRAEYLLNIQFSDSVDISQLALPANILDGIQTILGCDADHWLEKQYRITRQAMVLDIHLSPYLREQAMAGVIMVINDVTAQWQTEQDKNRFMLMVAHELKSPVAAIINYINVILTGMFDEKPAEVHKMLERCKIRGEDLLNLVNDLLYLNRNDANRVEKSIVKLDLIALIREHIEFYQIQAQKQQIKIEFTTDQPQLFVYAAKSDMDRVLANLLSNAIKYNKIGGRVHLAVSQEENCQVISVADTGIGMSAQEMQDLFAEFYRIKNAKTSGISGTGLGLSTVKRVLNEYNARITVDSLPDKGTTCRIYLPADLSIKT